MLIWLHGFWNYSFVISIFMKLLSKSPVASGKHIHCPFPYLVYFRPALFFHWTPMTFKMYIQSYLPTSPLKIINCCTLASWKSEILNLGSSSFVSLVPDTLMTLYCQTTLDILLVLCAPFHWMACLFSDFKYRMFSFPPSLLLPYTKLHQPTA